MQDTENGGLVDLYSSYRPEMINVNFGSRLRVLLREGSPASQNAISYLSFLIFIGCRILLTLPKTVSYG